MWVHGSLARAAPRSKLGFFRAFSNLSFLRVGRFRNNIEMLLGETVGLRSRITQAKQTDLRFHRDKFRSAPAGDIESTCSFDLVKLGKTYRGWSCSGCRAVPGRTLFELALKPKFLSL